MGRYLERAEHAARYLKVQYFSSLDAPFKENKEDNLYSVMEMVGLPMVRGTLTEEYVIENVSLNSQNENSIISSITYCKTNSDNARDVLSVELYEAISKYYHYVSDYSVPYLKTQGLYDFTQSVIEKTATIRNFINSTLLHDETWAAIRLGIHLERSVQVLRILKSIENQIEKHDKNEPSYDVYNDYYKTLLLKGLEAEVMFNKYYDGNPTKASIYEFTLLNDIFPRSVYYNVRKSVNLSENLFSKSVKNDPFKFRLNKLADEMKYILYEEFKSRHGDFIMDLIYRIEFITYYLEKEHLSHYGQS